MEGAKQAITFPKTLVWLVAVAAVVWIANPTLLYFLNDDFIYISKAPEMQYVYRTAFRPVSDLTLLLDYHFWRQNATGYHLTNLLLHLINTWLVWFTAGRLFRFLGFHDYHGFAATAAALLFLCYGMHSEAIFWIIGRGGLLICLFFLIALAAALQPGWGWSSYLISFICFLGGLLTYETIWVLPAVLTLLFWVKNRLAPGQAKRQLLLTLPFWVLLLLQFLLRKYYFGDFISSPYTSPGGHVFTPLIYVRNYGIALVRSFLPPMDTTWLMALTVVLVLAGAAWLWFRRQHRWHPTETFLIAAFLLTLSPALLLGVNSHNTESERLLYLPSAFLCLWLAIQLSHITAKGLKWIMLMLICAAQLVVLHRAALPFRYSSTANQTAMTALRGIQKEVGTLHVIGLPTQYRGGLMFRMGWPEALAWIAPGLRYTNMIVHSSYTYTAPPQIQVQMNDATATALIRGIGILPKAGDFVIAWQQDVLYIGEVKP